MTPVRRCAHGGPIFSRSIRLANWAFLFLLFGAVFLLLVPNQKTLPNGFHVEFAERGKTWVTDPQHSVLFESVKAVGVVDTHVLVETSHMRTTAPYGYAACEYFLLDTGTGNIRIVSANNPAAIRLTRQLIRAHEITRTSRSCLG